MERKGVIGRLVRRMGGMKESFYEVGWELWSDGQDEVSVFYQLQYLNKAN